jgi:hypothetical protein
LKNKEITLDLARMYRGFLHQRAIKPPWRRDILKSYRVRLRRGGGDDTLDNASEVVARDF